MRGRGWGRKKEYTCVSEVMEEQLSIRPRDTYEQERRGARAGEGGMGRPGPRCRRAGGIVPLPILLAGAAMLLGMCASARIEPPLMLRASPMGGRVAAGGGLMVGEGRVTKTMRGNSSPSSTTTTPIPAPDGGATWVMVFGYAVAIVACKIGFGFMPMCCRGNSDFLRCPPTFTLARCGPPLPSLLALPLPPPLFPPSHLSLADTACPGSLANAFSAGVFIASGIVHLLPEAAEGFGKAQEAAAAAAAAAGDAAGGGGDAHAHEGSKMPYILCLCGFMVTALIEKVAFMHGDEAPIIEQVPPDPKPRSRLAGPGADPPCRCAQTAGRWRRSITLARQLPLSPSKTTQLKTSPTASRSVLAQRLGHG